MAVAPVARDVDVANAVPNWTGAFEHVRAELHQEFDGRLPVDKVDRCFAAEVARFHDARISVYLHILIHKNARARLRAMEERPLQVQD